MLWTDKPRRLSCSSHSTTGSVLSPAPETEGMVFLQGIRAHMREVGSVLYFKSLGRFAGDLSESHSKK